MRTLLFVGTYTENTESEGIYAYELDPKTGRLHFLFSQGGIKNPTYLTINHHLLYAVSETPENEEGKVISYRLKEKVDGLEVLDTLNSGGTGTCYVELDSSKRWGALSNFHSGSLLLFETGLSGQLKQQQSIQYEGVGLHPTRQSGSHIHQSTFSPDGKYLLVCDLGLDKVWVYTIQKNEKEPLSLRQEVQTRPGGGPRHLVFHPNGKFVYLLHEIYPLITSFSFVSGLLTELQILPNWEKGSKTGEDGAEIKIDPSGTFLYASCRGSQNELGIYSIEKDSGRLKNTAFQSVFGSGPRDFEIIQTEDGTFLVVANQWSNSLVVFSIKKENGLLDKIGEYAIPSPVGVKAMKIE